jgi:penicillin-binding protein 2
MQNWLSENFPPNRSAQNNLSSGLFDKTRTVGRGNQSWVSIGIIGLGLIGGIGSRLAYLQLEQGAKNRQIAENNRVRTVAKPPVRGIFTIVKGRFWLGVSYPTRFLFGL